MVEGAISGNVIRNAKHAGIQVTSGNTSPGAATGNTVLVDINENQITAEMTQFDGINVIGGFASNEDADSPSANNVVTANISGNDIQESQSGSITVTGGFGNRSQSIQNSATVDIHDNVIAKSKYAAIRAAGGWSASESTAEVMIANNTVTNAGSNGIEINGGTARDRDTNSQGARHNTATGTIQGNTVRGGPILILLCSADLMPRKER